MEFLVYKKGGLREKIIMIEREKEKKKKRKKQRKEVIRDRDKDSPLYYFSILLSYIYNIYTLLYI